MRSLHRLVLLLATLAVCVTTAAFAQTPPAFTAAEMLKLKRISDPQVSPDGTRVAYVQTDVDLERNSARTDP